MNRELKTYLESEDIKTVADTARQFDTQTLISGYIDKETFYSNVNKSDKEIFMERNHHRDGTKR